MKRGKKYVAAVSSYDKSVAYDPAEAIAQVKKNATAKFDETIEAHIRTGCDGRHAEQQIRGAVVLPHGTGKTVRVLVFAKGAKLDEAQAAGADFVGGEELIPKIQNEGWSDFDSVVATPDMMGVVGRLGRVLGPRGLMPNPKAGVATTESKSLHPSFWIFGMSSSPPTKSAPAACASSSLAPLANTKTLTVLPVPCGSTTAPRICCSA